MEWSLKSVDGIVDQAIDWTGAIGLTFFTSFVVVKLGYEYYRASFGQNPTLIWDWQEISRVALLSMLILSWSGIAKSINSAVHDVTEITRMNSSMHKKIEDAGNKIYIENLKADYKKKQRVYTEMKETYKGNSAMEMAINLKEKRLLQEAWYDAGKMDGTADGNSEYSITREMDKTEGPVGANMMLSPTGGLAVAVTGLTVLLAGGVKVAVFFFMGVIFKIGLAFGPLVIAFSVFFREKLTNYIAMLLNVAFTFTTLNILDMMLSKFVVENLINPDLSDSLGFCLAMIGLYFNAFKITKMYAGEPGLGGVMTRAIGIGTGALGTMIGTAALGAKGAMGIASMSSSSTNVSNVARNSSGSNNGSNKKSLEVD